MKAKILFLTIFCTLPLNIFSMRKITNGGMGLNTKILSRSFFISKHLPIGAHRFYAETAHSEQRHEEKEQKMYLNQLIKKRDGELYWKEALLLATKYSILTEFLGTLSSAAVWTMLSIQPEEIYFDMFAGFVVGVPTTLPGALLTGYFIYRLSKRPERRIRDAERLFIEAKVTLAQADLTLEGKSREENLEIALKISNLRDLVLKVNKARELFDDHRKKVECEEIIFKAFKMIARFHEAFEKLV